MKMKNKGIIIALLIISSIIIFCLVMFLVDYLRSGMSFSFSFNIANRSTEVIYDEEFAIEVIKDIDIEQDAGDIKIKESENNKVKVVIYGEKEQNANVQLDEEKLIIENKNRKNKINFGKVEKDDIIVYMPSNYKGEIKIKNNYGECKIADLENATIDINCDYGNVKIGKIKNANIKCDCGNIKANEILNKCNIYADCGNVKIDRISIKENSTIKSDFGNVHINSTNDIYIDTDVDLGKTKINSNNRNALVTLEIKSNCGNIKVNN